MAKHTGKDIPIRDNGGNQIGMARVHEMSLRLGERGQQGIEVSLDIRFDNPLRTIDPFSLDGLHISLGDDPADQPEACGQRSRDAGAKSFVAIWVNRRERKILDVYPGDDAVERAGRHDKLTVYRIATGFEVIPDFVWDTKPHAEVFTPEALAETLYGLAVDREGRFSHVVIDVRALQELRRAGLVHHREGTSPLDTPGADNVVVLKPDANARTFTRDDSHGAEFRAAWTVIGPSRSTSGRFEVHDRRVVTEGPAVTAATLDELAESLLILSRLHPRTFTVSVSIPVAQELLKPDPEAASETSAQAIVRVTAEGLRIVPSTDSGDAEDADFVVTRNDPGLMEITNRRKKQTEAWAQGPEELRIVLGLLRKKVEPHDITVVLDRELAEQVIDR